MRIHHVGFVTTNPDKILSLFGDVLMVNLRLVDSRTVREWECCCILYEFSSAYVWPHIFHGDDAYIEIVMPYGGPLLRWCQTGQQPLHHVAVTVPSIDAACKMLTEQGIRLVAPEPVVGVAGLRVNFIHPEYCGVLLELVEVPR